MQDAREAALVGRLKQRAGEIYSLTERLVRVNSFTHNVQGVNAVGELLAEALAGTCLCPTERGSVGLGKHWVFATPARGPARVLLVGHHDTVFPPGTFEGISVSEGRAHGPGMLDMKGGLAVIASVLCVLDEASVLAGLPLAFVSVADEEIGSPSSQPLFAELAENAACALVFEAGRDGDKLITARRGSGSAHVTAHGRAAHAGNALAEGRNAIWSLSRFIDRAQRLNGTIEGAALNVGLAAGGSARNTVPALASCEIDLRFRDERSQAALQRALEEARIAAERDVPETSLVLTWTTARRPWPRSAGSAALAAQYGACQREAGLGDGETGVIGGGSDANTLGALGVPTIDGLGPRGRGFHTHQEQIEVASLTHKAEALLRFLLRFDAHIYKNERA